MTVDKSFFQFPNLLWISSIQIKKHFWHFKVKNFILRDEFSNIYIYLIKIKVYRGHLKEILKLPLCWAAIYNHITLLLHWLINTYSMKFWSLEIVTFRPLDCIGDHFILSRSARLHRGISYMLKYRLIHWETLNTHLSHTNILLCSLTMSYVLEHRN